MGPTQLHTARLNSAGAEEEEEKERKCLHSLLNDQPSINCSFPTFGSDWLCQVPHFFGQNHDVYTLPKAPKCILDEGR